VVSLFASPDGYVGSSTQAAIATSSGTFTSVWQSTDGYGYGVTFVEPIDQGVITEEDTSLGKKDQLNRDTIEISIDAMVRTMSGPVTVTQLTCDHHSYASQSSARASTTLFPFVQIVFQVLNVDSRSRLPQLLLLSMLPLTFSLDFYPSKTFPLLRAL
jgi:hypothetical protein